MELTKRTCPLCNGEGFTEEPRSFSDGWSIAVIQCGLCDGEKTINKNPIEMVVDLKEQLRREKYDHKNLKVAVAIHLALEETGELPNPPLKDAPNPYPYPDRWLRDLKEATATLSTKEEDQ